MLPDPDGRSQYGRRQAGNQSRLREENRGLSTCSREGQLPVQGRTQTARQADLIARALRQGQMAEAASNFGDL